MADEQQDVPLKLGWQIDGGFILCRYIGHVLDQKTSDDRLCWVMIDSVISCRLETDSFSTDQLSLSEIPAQFHTAVNKLIGQTRQLVRLRVEHDLLQYILPP